MAEADVIFRRDVTGEKVIVIKQGVSYSLGHPSVNELIKELKLPYIVLESCLDLNFEPVTVPIEREIFNTRGRKIEDMTYRIARTSVGEIEVDDILLHPAVVSRDKSDMGFHLRVGSGGFEIIYVQTGQAKMAFPDKVLPIGEGLYIESGRRKHVQLSQGCLAIIQAPVANAWIEVGKNFRFRYLCQPPWSTSFVKPVLKR